VILLLKKFVFLMLIIFNVTRANALSAKSSILIDANTGRVLMSENSKERLGPASTTKIMTAIVAIENGGQDGIVTVSANAAGIEGSSIYLKQDEKIRLKDLLFGLMLGSGNDAGTAVAEHIAGNTENFALLMQQKVKDLGLCDTSFTNPHGLDDNDHYTTAFDLAQITRYALLNKTFSEIVSTRIKTVYSDLHGEVITKTFSNHNKMLSLYRGCVGVKTGFTKKTGRCLVSAVQKDGLKLIAVSLSAPDDWNDHAQMMDYGFLHYKLKCPVKTGDYIKSVPLIGADADKISLYARSDLFFAAKDNEKARILYSGMPNFIKAPVYQGQCYGTADIFIGKEKIKTTDLIAMEDIPALEKPCVKNSYCYILKELFNLFR